MGICGIKLGGWLLKPVIPAVFALSAIALGQTGRFETVSLPLAINIEGRPVRSNLYLQVETKTYQMTLEQFGAQKLDAREKLFIKGVRAIRTRDYETLRSIWKSPAENPQASVSLPMSNDPKAYLEAYTNGYGNYQGLKVMSQMELGSNSLFLWGAKAKTGMFFPDGLIVQPSGANLALVPTTPSTPVANMIVDTMVAASADAAPYSPVKDTRLRYSLVLSMEGAGRPGQHPIALQFDGTLLNFNAFAADDAPPNQVLAFYREAFMAFKSRSFDDFLKKFTSESQPGVKTWLANVKTSNAESYFQTVSSGRYVKFLLNADPVYLVFYSGDKSDKWVPGSLHYDYVVRDAKSGTYKLANFGFTSSFDDILRDQGLFNQEVFRFGGAPTAQQSKKSM
ncbi:MAG TPA: hypothetical protein VG488_10415 [Candidatus Angelobacter sp.]|nr:hypothetical protein [Candidatus Angelobacter sp.]